MERIILNNISIEVIRKDIKNIHLAVYPPNGRVRIAAPIGVNDDTIRFYAVLKLGWIKRRIRKFEEQERISLREYKSRESHYFLGRRYLLNVIKTDSSPKVVLKNKTFIELHIRPNTSTIKSHKIMTEWYRKELKEIIPDLIKRWEKKTNINVDDWKIKHMKTKWGSCNIEKRRIWLNLELAKKPLHCIEYIIVHEMVHLLVRRHNDKFKEYMNKFMPNWKKYRKELNYFPLSHEDWKY